MTENDLQREVQKLRYQIKLADRLEVKLDACIDLLERSNPPKGGNTDKHIRGAKTALAAWKKSREVDVAELRARRRPTAAPAQREGDDDGPQPNGVEHWVQFPVTEVRDGE